MLDLPVPTSGSRAWSALGSIAISVLSACATVASGAYGVPVADAKSAGIAAPRSGLRVSAGEVTALASRFFGVVEVTFENDGPAWVQIDRVDLDFGTPAKNQATLLPWGADLETWQNATVQRNRVRLANTQAGLALVALCGDILETAGRRNPTTRAVGGLAEAGALDRLLAADSDLLPRAARSAQ